VALVGSTDGTLYVFNRSRTTATAAERPLPESQPSQPTSPLPRDSRATSRSSTPSTASPAPFSVIPRSRIVSGVTTEQVEAPKNYVDFDDEPDKLKDILRGRGPREGKERINGSDVASKSPTPSLLGIPSATRKRRSATRPALSLADIPVMTTDSTSSSMREHAFLEPPNDLTLWCHIILPQSGPGKAVTNVRLLDHDDSLAVLQETGSVIRRNSQ